jgi:hypothetical protein
MSYGRIMQYCENILIFSRLSAGAILGRKSTMAQPSCSTTCPELMLPSNKCSQGYTSPK